MTKYGFTKLRRRAAWCAGNGPFAVLAHCPRALTIKRYASREDAAQGKSLIDQTGCGGLCCGNHQIVEIDA